MDAARHLRPQDRAAFLEIVAGHLRHWIEVGDGDIDRAVRSALSAFDPERRRGCRHDRPLRSGYSGRGRHTKCRSIDGSSQRRAPLPQQPPQYPHQCSLSPEFSASLFWTILPNLERFYIPY